MATFKCNQQTKYLYILIEKGNIIHKKKKKIFFFYFKIKYKFRLQKKFNIKYTPIQS